MAYYPGQFGLVGDVETIGSKLLTKLFPEAYKEYCDPNNEGFRRVIARLFFFHV
jgi:hypothetical protein